MQGNKVLQNRLVVWAAIIKYQDWVAYNNRNLFLTILEVRTPTPRCQRGCFLCPHMVEWLTSSLGPLL